MTEARQLEAIASLVKQYRPQKDFYLKAARFASELCKSRLASNAIRGMATYRAKEINSLERKLAERSAKGALYNNFDDVKDNVMDLAGVRIALYFPSDADKI